jgi:glycosyltransferase involved in cell wall biosynthesis
MRISIAVPSLNYGHYLRECLDSIRKQSHTDVEVLIADGGSADNSSQIIEEFTAQDERVRCISRTDHGQAAAVQKAFEVATGDVFGFLNADDCYLSAFALERVVAAFDEHPDAGVVTFGGWYIDHNGRRLKRVRLRYHPFDGLQLMRYRTAVLQPATFWRRGVQQRFPMRIDLHYLFDAWFFYEAFTGFKWAVYEDAIAGYRLHGGNKSVGVRPDRIRELALFEAHKFGTGNMRQRYLEFIGTLAAKAEQVPMINKALQRTLYTTVNSVSFASVYRLPGI